MHLKNIQLVGFKSFAEKTNVEFLAGVTAIVGPNGCGKSNISDAIRWVLGEQSAKALRGGEMADVIFNGTDTRKPFGMAEVSLTFTDCKDILKTGQLAGVQTNFNEVTVTRRVFRDGNSEYLINNTSCRLKDVQLLFMDTGIGRSSYSIMEQGKIDKILSSQPEDRRAIFEEAAGITKFKSQKKEALRKFEYTEANLNRVSDIIKEIKRQINSLQRQVGKARRYQSLTGELKHLDTQLGRCEFEKIQAEVRFLEDETRQLKIKIEEIRQKIGADEQNTNHLREQLGLAENKRQQVLQRQRDVQSEVERYETRIRTNVDRIAETETTVQNAEKEASEARSRSVEIQNRMTLNRSQLTSTREQLSKQTANLQQAQAAFKEADAAERAHDDVIHRLQSKLLGLEGTLANLRNQVSSLEKQHQEFGLQIQKLVNEKAHTSGECQKLLQRAQSIQTELRSYKQTFEASLHAVAGGEDALREAENQCQLLAGQISEEQRLLSEKTSRRDVLHQLHESYEGYSEGAQTLLRQFSEGVSDKTDPDAAPKILGAIVNLIDVEPRFSAAIEVGLGRALQSIVVSEFQTALDLVKHLRDRDMGHASFAIRNGYSKNHSAGNFQKEPLSGSLGWAKDVVRSNPAILEFVHRMLADVVLVEGLHQAVELYRQHPGLTWITLEGDILDHHGILSVGSRRISPGQFIGRRNEITSLEAETKQLESRLHDLSVSKGEWEGRRALARQALGSQQSELRLQENDLTKKETSLGAIQEELRGLESKVTAIDLEILERERLKRDGEANLVRIKQELAQAEANQTSAQSELNTARQQSEALAKERHDRSVAANDLHVMHATIEQQIHNLEAQFQPLEIQNTESQQFIASRETEIRSGRQRIVQWQGENAESIQRTESLRDSVSGITNQITEIESEKARLDSAIQVATEKLRELRIQLDIAQKHSTEYEIRLTEKRGESGHLCERIAREYSADLTSIQLLPLKGISADTESTEKEASIQNSETFSSLNFANWDEVSARVTELRSKIQSMGPVNLEAVQEYEELEQRFTFLNREHDDLVLAKEQLLEILQKINVTTRKMFFDTFEKIKVNFQSVFTELFGGGKADLLLVDENDPLECGIEIVAKPPGKQLQSITLLSGGERTMTAVALLFAIYRVKPSPFCVLDEMDAPLDESNINRFVKMLERFLVHSQFVVITHNKRTIAMADALYGVTMEERGVSKLVSVRFHKKQDGSEQDSAISRSS